MSRLNFVGIRPPAPPRPYYQTGVLRASIVEAYEREDDVHEWDCACALCDPLEAEFCALELAVRQRECRHGPWVRVQSATRRLPFVLCQQCGKELD